MWTHVNNNHLLVLSLCSPSLSLSPRRHCALYREAFLNKTRVYNKDVLYQAVEAKRRNNVPLLTVSNHHSCFDDPGIWGELAAKDASKKNNHLSPSRFDLILLLLRYFWLFFFCLFIFYSFDPLLFADRPSIAGVLPLKHICNHNVIRWSLAAHDICFTNKHHSMFFMSGRWSKFQFLIK